MLIPKKVKHRKHHQGHFAGVATRKTVLSFGSVGIKAIEGGWITSRQIEAARRAMTRHLSRGGKVWIRIFPDKPITYHGNENTMGGGKGAPEYYVYVTKPGTVLFEIDGVSEKTAVDALNLASYKLPLKTKIIKKQ